MNHSKDLSKSKMGSNKRHKNEKVREVKKKRHRSRSRSYSPTERERLEKSRHHKKHHRRKERSAKDYDSDVEIVTAPPPPKISKSSGPLTPPPPPEISKDRSSSPGEGSGGATQTSLSIEESNKLRAKLGLKPLEVSTSTSSKEDSQMIKDDLGEFYHKPAPNAQAKAKTEKLKEKLQTHKQKRQIETNLSKIKPLGGSDSEDDARVWIDKSRRLQEEKRKAEQRAKMLDQMDEEFGIENLVQEEIRSSRKTAYTKKHLEGLRVEHDIDNIKEGKTMILTLKDQEVLDEGEDVLVNVNITDEERYKRNLLNKTKKLGYDAYDDDHYDEYGHSKGLVLNKYDEEIEGQKKDSFILGVTDLKTLQSSQERKDMIKQRLLMNKRLETLEMAEPKIASEYYNEEELAKFKKPKKKIRKIRSKKKLKADDLIPDTDYLRDLGSRRKREEPKDENVLDVDDLDAPKEDLSGIKIEEEEDEKDFQLKLALKKNVRSEFSTSNRNNDRFKIEPNLGDVQDQLQGNIVLNATAEFCRTLGDIPTYGLAGNREENGGELMDFEMDGIKEEPMVDREDDDGRGAWNTVKLDENKIIEPVTMEASILDVEPSLGQGVGGALRLAMSKGYLEKEDTNRPSASRFAHLQAQNYSIEDKTYVDDDKFGRRDRFNGPTSEFKEKDGYEPNVKLEYIDDDGHVLSAKEAFRYLSHKFHGKGPGKNKVEKRMKKAEQEVLMKRMSSTDTPLGTLNLLQAKQKETQSPYIVLSGSKQMQTTHISKMKH